MKTFSVILLLLVVSNFAEAMPPSAASSSPLVSVDALERAARRRANAASRITLADDASERLRAVKLADPLETSHTPNYIRALAQHTQTAPQFAHLIRTFLYGGTLPSETKMAMALRIAQTLDSPYTAAHAQRWLRASRQGQKILALLRANKTTGLTSADALALAYAEALTRDIHGVTDENFQRVRGAYNDSQIVELTMTVCFFNYFARMSEALHLPSETWTLDETTTTPASLANYQPRPTRVALISDDEITATGAVAATAKEPQKPTAGLGLGIANSQRAMLRVPALALAWRGYGGSVRENASINRELQLHISFAVSMANGCRYCTLHQVLGLRRLGVDPAKLVAMKKDDSVLSPRELIAVAFARKSARAPSSITDEDFSKLKTEFGERGALEIVLQTCAFSFMNRFTDGLRLPSEDEAIRTYQEVYGVGWQ